ncbi:NB-ARC domain-containing protein [Streptantibioticus parmotrematis]|uniref:NB-ARC domain-containing protein n=1 Tax=Streptantibioticus parmotrematis TaxID=2873249 RepID=UPI0027E009AA|nr:NB-ARC domain-containing protein [Streptantibioticus parmotrematis]
MSDEVPGTDGERAAASDRDALPPGPERFVGRERELRELRADIDTPSLDALRGRPAATCRVLLVAGRPGSGRTALALRLAREQAARYPEGLLYAALTDPQGEPRAAREVAAQLLRGLGREADDDPEAALREALRERRVLLVLDDAASGEQVAPLLPHGETALVVATSRGPLAGVADVRPCTLGGLQSAACVELLAQAIGSTRVTCDPRAAETLAERCGGSPAALRLMAGWLADRPGMSVTDAVRVLPDDDATPLERAFGVVAAQLPGPAARLMRMLVLAPGALVDAHLASALAGCALEAARDALEDFARYGLLRRDPGPGAGTEPAAYRVAGWAVPLLRDALEAGERAEEVRLARARMLERTVRLVRACAASAAAPDEAATDEVPLALRFADREAASGWLRRRLPELLGAARIAVADGELDTLARRLASAAVLALDAHGQAAPERYELHGLLLEVAERRGPDRERAAALINLGDLDAAAGRTKDAVARYRAALDAARAGRDAFTLGRALEALGDSHLELGDRERAADWYGRALAQRGERGELADAARLHTRLALLHTDDGRRDAALREWRAAAAAYRRLRDHAGYAATLAEVALAQEVSGAAEESLRTGQEALRWARQADDARLQRVVLLGMARVLERLGDTEGARLQREAADGLAGPGDARDS